jgi:ABC-type amino acid transport substrate-binding protein
MRRTLLSCLAVLLLAGVAQAVEPPRKPVPKPAAAATVNVAPMPTKATPKLPSPSAGPASPKEALAAAKVLRVAVEGEYPPFNERGRDGKFAGFDIDIANALCQRLQRQCRFVQRDWASIQDALTGKSTLLGRDADAIISSASITDNRRMHVAFTKPYYRLPARLVAKRGMVAVVDAGLAGKRIGVQEGTTFEQFAAVRFPGVRLVRFPTQPAANAALAQGQVDLVFADALTLERSFL